MDGSILDMAVGYLAAWFWTKARRIAGRADDEVDNAVDYGMDRIHDLVAEKLGSDQALDRLEAEAGGDLDRESTTARTRQRVLLALEEAVEADEEFARRLNDLVEQTERSQPTKAAQAGDQGVAVGGDVRISADRGSAASWNMGSPTFGNPTVPGTQQ